MRRCVSRLVCREVVDGFPDSQASDRIERARAQERKVRLRELRLARVDISAPVAQFLARALKANSSLLRLTLDDCFMQLAQARILNSILYESTALREFHLTLDEHGNPDAHQIARAFAAAAARSSILLQMTMGPTVRDGLAQAQNRLAENRRRLQPGLET